MYIRVLFLLVCFGATSAFAQGLEKRSIRFNAVVGEKPFDCSQTYDGIGTTASKISVTDFRLFVHDVRLVTTKGVEVPIALTPDGKFQSDSVALLDFENGAGSCRSGTPELNTAIVGEVKKGKYSGIKFKLGVPLELNHMDPAKLQAPLNITRMMWSWQLGAKFARIDLKTTGRPGGYFLHLGSTECVTAADGNTTCKNGNRPEYSFAKFDTTKDVITVDLKQLFTGANVDTNQDKTALGCMSFEGDADCAPVFSNLGLSFAGSQAKPQTFMRTTNGAAK